jgi:enterochelin esterase-like enzyme
MRRPVWLLLACTILLFSGCGFPATRGAPLSGKTSIAAQSNQTIMCDQIDGFLKLVNDPVERGMLEGWRNVCALETSDVTLADAKATLAGKRIALSVKEDVLTLFQVSENGPPTACCSIQNAVWRDLGDSQTYAARFRLKDLQSGMLTQFDGLSNAQTVELKPTNWRGPNAPAPPVKKEKLEGTLLETTLYSPQLGETRRLVFYQPRSAAKRTGALPVVVLADGETLSTWAQIVEPLIDKGQVAPVLMIGLVSGKEGIVEDRSDLQGDVRMRDYLLTEMGAPSRFNLHLAFVTDTVLPWAESQYGASSNRTERVVTGYSNGGVFALNAGFQRPDVFGHAWPMSVGVDGISDAAPAREPAARFRMSAGYYEPGFMFTSESSAKSLTQAGYSVHAQWYAAGHMSDQWDDRLLENLKAVFPGENTP